jgi:sensor histidine kinase regulating citrate/malate metabolism
MKKDVACLHKGTEYLGEMRHAYFGRGYKCESQATEIAVVLALNGHRYRLDVRDDGMGMPDTVQGGGKRFGKGIALTHKYTTHP